VIFHPTIPIGSHFFAKKSAVDSGESGGGELKATGSSSVNRNLSRPFRDYSDPFESILRKRP
jgi:hypothetical protein